MQPLEAVSFDALRPTLAVAIPRGFAPPADVAPPTGGRQDGGVQLAVPSIPNPGSVEKCHRAAVGAEGERWFYECLVHEAIPQGYRIDNQCRTAHSDPAEALLCTEGRGDLLLKYRRVKEVNGCLGRGDTSFGALSTCVGQPMLGANERFYLGCLTENHGDFTKGALCALTRNLTPEQQIAMSCAVTSGGIPKAYVACVGGQLVAREITKCWEYGVATDRGCYGPNNEIRKFFDGVDGQVRGVLGEWSEAYRAYRLMHNNVWAPGPRHEFVKFINNGINDVSGRAGPGNEFVKAGKTVDGLFKSVGRSVRCMFGC